MPRRVLNLEGQRFGRLLVVSRAENNKQGQARWLCRCDCGTIRTVESRNLRQGLSRSCGCAHNTGVTNRSEYRAYHSARQRCVNPKNPRYVDYGGRGIRFLFTSFEQFLSHIGRKPSPELTLDRIENNGHYEPGNVRWATRAEQQRNQRSNVLTMNEAERIRRLAVSGHATTDLSRKFQVSPSIISQVITYRTWIPEIHSAQEEAVAV